MPNYAVSERWAKGSEAKIPFNYGVGKGILSDEQAEAWDPKKGQLCFVQRLDMGDLIKLGIAEELDFMTKELVAGDAPKTAETPGEAIGRAIMKADNYERMELMTNLVVGSGVLQPRLHQPPVIKEIDGRTGKVTNKPNPAAKQKGLIYVDSIPWNDRLELFGVIFESEGLSDFREEQEAGVGDVADVPSVPVPANGPVELRSENSEGVLPESGSLLLRTDGPE